MAQSTRIRNNIFGIVLAVAVLVSICILVSYISDGHASPNVGSNQTLDDEKHRLDEKLLHADNSEGIFGENVYFRLLDEYVNVMSVQDYCVHVTGFYSMR